MFSICSINSPFIPTILDKPASKQRYQIVILFKILSAFCRITKQIHVLPEFLRMIEFNHMAQFMNHNILHQVTRQHNQLCVEADFFFSVARTPYTFLL